MKFSISWGVLETHLLSQYLSSCYWNWGNCIIVLLYCVLLPCGHLILSRVSWVLHNEVRHWSGLASCIMPQVFREQLLLTSVAAVFLMIDPYWHWINSLNKILHAPLHPPHSLSHLHLACYVSDFAQFTKFERLWVICSLIVVFSLELIL